MKKLLMTMSVAMLTSVSAQAADLAARPYTKAPAYVEPATNWSGFYMGLNAGYNWASSGNADLVGVDPTSIALIGAGVIPSSLGGHHDGFIGGGQLGYNWQFANVLVGLEGDIQGLDSNNTTSVTNPFIGSTFTTTVNSKIDYLGTVRGRLGVLPANNVLLYVTGGLAYGGVEHSALITNSVLGPYVAGSFNETKTGWTVGGGVEWMFAQHWTAKAEYLYYDLGNTTVALPNAGTFPGALINATFKDTGSIARAGVNYHF